MIVADLAIGAVIVLVLAAAASAAGMVVDAEQSSREAARSAAVELARGVDTGPAMRRAQRLAPEGAEIGHEFLPGAVRVWVASELRLPHPVFLSTHLEIRSEVVVPMAPYRSGP